MDDLAFIIIIILLLVIIIYFIVRLQNPNKPPTPVIITPSGGCAGTQYGCCPNSNIAKHDYIGSNCSSIHPIIINPPSGGCAGTQYVCCPNSNIAKHDYIGSNCASIHPIIINPPSPYHPPPTPEPYQPPGGCAGTQYGCCPYSNIAKHDSTGSNCISNKIGGCAGTQYGCCPDGITPKNANGLCS